MNASVIFIVIFIIAVIGAVIALSIGSKDEEKNSLEDVQIVGKFRLTFEKGFSDTEKNHIIPGATKLSDVITNDKLIPVSIYKYYKNNTTFAFATKTTGDIFSGGTVSYNTNYFPNHACDWGDLTMHEFLHFMGFTTGYSYWNDAIVDSDPGPCLNGGNFTCAHYYYDLAGAGSPSLVYPNIPLEVGNTYPSHWNEALFDTEIMTPITSCKSNDLLFSRITAGALQDMGFDINYDSSTICMTYSLTP